MKQSIEKAMAELKMSREELSSALGMSRPYITKMLTCPQSEKTQAKVVKMIDGLIKDKNMKSMSCLEITGVSVDCGKIQEQQKIIKELNQALEYKDQLLAKNEDDLHKQTNRVNAYKDDNSKLSLKISTQQKSIEDKDRELFDCKMDNSCIRTELKALKRENKDIQINHAIVCVILIILKDGAPSGAQYWRDMDSVCHPMEILYYAWFGGVLSTYEGEKGWVKSIYHDDNEYILDQLKPL